MKRLTMQTLFAAAALTVVATGASAQTLTAEIPFTFHAGPTVMTPGKYRVQISDGRASTTLWIRNLDTGKALILVPGPRADAPKAWRADGHARLGFECAGVRCSLREVWGGGRAASLKLNSPKPGHDGAVRLAEVMLSKAN